MRAENSQPRPFVNCATREMQKSHAVGAMCSSPALHFSAG